MKYAKLIHGKIELASNEIQIGDDDVTNPIRENYLAAGFREFVQTQPEDKKWYNPAPKYSTTKTQIIQEWDYKKVPKPDYDSLVESRIAEKYTTGAELSLNRKGVQNPEHPAYVEYLQWIEESKAWAEEQIREWEEA